MTPKQRRFIEEYVKDCNATQACLRAGYDTQNPDVVGPHLYSIPEIHFAIQEKLKALGKKTETEAEYIRRVFKTVIERSLLPVPVMEFDREAKEYVQKTDPDTGEGVFEYDAQAVIAAAAWLGKAEKMFTDNLNISGLEGLAERVKRAREKAKKDAA